LRPSATWYYPGGKIASYYSGTLGSTWYWPDGSVLSYNTGRPGATYYCANNNTITDPTGFDDGYGNLDENEFLDWLYVLKDGCAPPTRSLVVVNGASFTDGLVPGSIGTLYIVGAGNNYDSLKQATSVPLPLTLDGVSVYVNGWSAPLFAVARSAGATQVNFQVPMESSAGSSIEVKVSEYSLPTLTASVSVRAAAPAIFYSNFTTHEGAVTDLSYRLVSSSNPARGGKVITVWATGLGATTPYVQTNQVGPSQSLAVVSRKFDVLLDGVKGTVLWAGLAPGFIGLYQLNVTLPAVSTSHVADLKIVDASSGAAGPAVKLQVAP
jgi:uncharacterized protein (TIGR03437 family)